MAYSKYLNHSGIDIASGRILNTTGVHKFGAVPSMSTGVSGSIWDLNDTKYPWGAIDAAGAVPLTVLPVNIADSGKKVIITGLDENFLTIREEIVLSNTLTKTTINNFTRVNLVRFVNGLDANVGNITVQKAGITVARILAGKGQTLMAVHTIPHDCTGYLIQGTASIKYGADATIDMYVRLHEETSFILGHSGEVAGTGMPYKYEFSIPIMLPGGSDIDVRTSVRSNNARVTAAFDLIMIKN